jgi:cation transport ATPase
MDHAFWYMLFYETFVCCEFIAMILLAEVMGAFSREQPIYFQRNNLGIAALVMGALCLLFLSIFPYANALFWIFYLVWHILYCLLMILIMKTLKTSSWPGILKRLANMGALLIFLGTLYFIVIDVIFYLIAPCKTMATRYGFWNFIGFAIYSTGVLFMMMVITVMGLRNMSAKKTGGNDNDDAEAMDHTEKLHHPDDSSNSDEEV